MSTPATITLELTPHEFDVLTWLFTFGGYVASAEPEDGEVPGKIADVRQQYHQMPEVLDRAEGTLNRKLLAAERQRGAIPAEQLDKLDKLHDNVGGAWSGT